MELDWQILNGRDFSGEFVFHFSRSGGKGGQNVNKVNTKAELRFSVRDSVLLTDEEKIRLNDKLASKLTLEGELLVVCQTARTQLENRERAIEKFYETLVKALTPKKKRTPTRPSLASKIRRIEGKKLLAEKKERRKKILTQGKKNGE